MGSRRQERVSQVIRRIVSQMIIQDVKDPRVGFVTVLGVELESDFSAAKVILSVLGTDNEKNETVAALNSMKGFFQKELGPALRTRLTPILSFALDERVAKSMVLDKLIARARSGDPDHNDSRKGSGHKEGPNISEESAQEKPGEGEPT